jgi:hypothetical protein
VSNFKSYGLGDRVKDPITGVTGVVVAVTTWLHGCIRICIQPEKPDKDGKPKETIHFDQSQLKLVKRGVQTPMVLGVVAAPAPETRRSNGGPSRETSGFSR